MRPSSFLSLVVSISSLGLPPASAPGSQAVPIHLPAVATNSAPVGRLPGSTNLALAIGLPLRNTETLTNLLRQIYDPANPSYRHYLTPEQFTAMFGPTEQDYQALIAFAESNGFTVTGMHPNRTLLDVKASVATIDKAFHVTMRVHQHPVEARTFYAPDVQPSLDVAIPILGISGLDNYSLPRPRHIATPLANAQRAASNLGSGPSGTYMGNDFHAAYVPGSSLTGSGQIVGLLQFDGYHANDIAYYESRAGLPSVTLSNVLLDGFNGVPTGSGGEIEVSLDIEMAISMAPGVSKVIVYEAGPYGNWHDILNRMATDNLAKQLSCSWYTPGGGPDPVADQIWQQMAAQGQSFFNASGDKDAYTGPIDFPGDTFYITQVGGTTLTTSDSGGPWASETVWNWGNGTGSGGGISTSYPIPSWQTNISMTTNQGSTTMRNTPDVALTADNVYVRADGGDYRVAGTSCAAPLWAGFTALINQLALENGQPVVGFINPAVYTLGQGASYTSSFHDITTGNNQRAGSGTNFPAVPGYDLCTGWGTPTGSNLMYAIGVPEPLRITLGTGVLFTGPVGGPFSPGTQSYWLTNKATGSLSWTLVNTSLWLNVSPSNGTLTAGGPATVVTVSLTSAASNLVAGSYSATVRFMNLNDQFVQSRRFTLAVVTPPVITLQPASQAVLEGTAATFTVGTASNAILFFQWRNDNGSYLTNLTDGGNISGSTTSTLTVANVSAADQGAYSVVVSNAAGVATSSDAFLAILPWRPVITQQPVGQTVLPGAPVTFSVAAVGTHPFSYQWRQNGANLTDGGNISGSATSSLSIGSVSPANAGTYTVIVSNTLGSATSTGAVLSLIPVTAPGVTLVTLSAFNGGNGQFPYSPLVLVGDGNFYGTTMEGGTYGDGTVFQVTTNGTITALVSFNGNDGAIPYAGLLLGKDGNLYGTTAFLGNNGYGTVFRITTGGAFTTLASFNGFNGFFSVGGLVEGKDGNFYGTTYEGGPFGYGNVFKMTPDGTLTNLFSFNGDDGAYPSCVLVQDDEGNFYGTTEYGGTTGWGTVFKITPWGTLTTVVSFNDANGGIPVAGLVQDNYGNFYGTAYYGGTNYSGSIFKMSPDGIPTNLYLFTGGADGMNPFGGLLLSTDGNFYGTTENGGTYSNGTVFRIDRSGTLTTLVEFDGYQGANPEAAPVQGTDGNLYGTTKAGGVNGVGAVYRLIIDSPLQITSQPENQLAYLGETVSFSVATFGSLPVSYQWRRYGTNLTDGGNISGSNARILTLTNVTLANVGIYSVIVSNTYGSVTSTPALLELVLSPPFITRQPASETILAGGTAVFSVEAEGDMPLFYQWEKNGTNLTDGGNISGSTASTLIISGATVADQGTYSVIVSDDLYWVESSDAVLTVVPVVQPGFTMSTLRSFTGGGDGAYLNELVQGTDGCLYGTAQRGGANGYGTVFRITTDGSLTTLVQFDLANGVYPYAGLVQGTDGYFYGTTLEGGPSYSGSVFKMTIDGTITNLYSFRGGLDGNYPTAGLIQCADGNLYGTTYEGGTNGGGTVFRISTNGTLTTLYSFAGGDDGMRPWAGLMQGTDGNLYGTTVRGGANGYGTVFRLALNGTLTTLVRFNWANGAYPVDALVQGTDGNLYGTTEDGGTNGYGTVFRMTTNGVLTTLFQFNGDNGTYPAAGLVQGTDGYFYGTTYEGGISGYGTVFRITTNGTLTTLVWFNWSNGAFPEAPLIQADDGSFYGTTYYGGASGYGTVFQLIAPLPIPQPVFKAITATNGTLTLTWSAAARQVYQLQYNSNLNFTNWTSLGNAITATSGTISASDAVGSNMQRFYRVVVLH